MAATKPTTSDCCHEHERDKNELKDLLISMKLSINILENIKRLSNDYIDKMGSVTIHTKRRDSTHANHLKKFQTTLDNIRRDLCYWNKKYDSKILFDKSCGDDEKITSIFSTSTHKSNGNNGNKFESNGVLQSNPPVANPSEGTGLGHRYSSGDVGTKTVAVAGNHDHQDHDHGDDDDENNDQNNSEHLTSNGESRLMQSESSNEEKKIECANNPNDDDDEDEDDVDDDRYLQRNGFNRLKSGDVLLPTELCEMSLETTSDSTQNGIDDRCDSCEMSNLQNNTLKKDHSKGGRETGALMFKKTRTGTLPSLHWIKLTRGDSFEKSNDVRLFERSSQTTEKSSSDGGAHSSAHHHSSKSTTFNSIHSKSTSMDQASMVINSNQNLTSKLHTESLNHYTTPKIHNPMFLCDHKGCEFKTNTRQRLSMHKRTHAGEILYHCDVVGCDYISNYKGNIKIHQKHRHRFGSTSTGNKTTGCGGIHKDMITISDDDDEEEGDEDNGAAAVAAAVVESSASNPSSRMMDINPSTNARGRKRSFSYSFLVQTNNMDNENVSMSSADLEPPAKADTVKEQQPIKEYRCKVDGCSYCTKWKQCLQAHEFLHAGIKPYKCDYPGCGYRTNFKSNVNVHKRQHSGTTSLFRCDLSGCGFSTPWKSSFSTHQRNHQNQRRHMQQTSIDESPLAANKSSEKPQSSNVSEDFTSDNLIIKDQNEDQEEQIIDQILNENQEKLSIQNNRNRIYWPTKTGK